MPPDAAIRPATVADSRRIAEIHVAAWHAAYRGLIPDVLIDAYTVEQRERLWTEQLAAKPDLGIVAEDAGRVVGWCTFGPYHLAEPAGCGEVYGLYLDPAERRRGIGRRLWHTAADTLARRGLTPIAVLALAVNASARRFYEALGGQLDANDAGHLERHGIRLPQVRYWFDTLRSAKR